MRAPTTTTTTTAPPVVGDRPGFVTRRGSTLYLDGKPYRFTGVSAYQLATLWSVNWGCGAQVIDIDRFLGSLRPASMIKVNATQAQAFNNKTTFTIDWAPFDRMVSAAERHGQKLIMGLSAQQGDCDDGHWKDRAWYDDGYRQAFNDDGRNLARLSYLDWIQRVVARYKDSPAVGMWQLVGEPEPSNCASGYSASGCYGHLTCPSGGAASLRAFFDTVGAEVKRIDPHHLIGSGVIGGGQCGLVGAEFAHVHASPYIDVATYHDYGADDVAVPAELQLRLDQARQLGKPLVVDEVGIYGGDMAGCLPTALRTAKMQAKMVGGFAAGVQGFTPWNWTEDDYGTCGYNIIPVDPLMTLLRDFPL